MPRTSRHQLISKKYNPYEKIELFVDAEVKYVLGGGEERPRGLNGFLICSSEARGLPAIFADSTRPASHIIRLSVQRDIPVFLLVGRGLTRASKELGIQEQMFGAK